MFVNLEATQPGSAEQKLAHFVLSKFAFMALFALMIYQEKIEFAKNVTQPAMNALI